MGVFPEPAHCADDAGRLVPGGGTVSEDAAVRWLHAAERHDDRRRPRSAHTGWAAALSRKAVAMMAVGLAFAATLPEDALAPAAEAHDRIDLRAPRDPAVPGLSPEWQGLPAPAETPSTLSLIEKDLARLRGEADAPDEAVLDADSDSFVFGEHRVPRPLVETILRAARETEVDPVYLMALADKESSFQPEVRAGTSSAEGLFQFLSGTWFEVVRSFGARHGLEAEAGRIERRGGTLTVADPSERQRILSLRRDPYVASLMAGEMMKRDRARVEQRLGRDLKTTEYYLAHFFGAASAGRFMEMTTEKPGQVAQQAFRAAAQANRSLFFERSGRKTRSLTIAEVYERLDGMIDRRLDRYQSVAGIAERIDMRRPGEMRPTAAVFAP
ncbi:lytic transglycosylase domain-containing protein [Methylobacterium oryzihabitans]|uniref:Lytic transglycosylase domain-containing protein n=1 Tax=Methylobacterium oryzihabitans TaxID=2499852 RepID=A0A3S2XIS7_9HYPH|nr:lytic transglycosylase domain-containing protein [Methylobacterium oryzihabitans]